MVGEVTYIMEARKQKGEQGPSPGLIPNELALSQNLVLKDSSTSQSAMN